MGRVCPSMLPFNVEKFVFQLVSPMACPTLKGASRHKHRSKVNFVRGGSRFHAASDSRPAISGPSPLSRARRGPSAPQASEAPLRARSAAEGALVAGERVAVARGQAERAGGVGQTASQPASVRTDVRSDVRAEAPRRLAPLITKAPRRLAPLRLCPSWRRGGWLRARDARNRVRLVLATCFFFSDAVVAHAV